MNRRPRRGLSRLSSALAVVLLTAILPATPGTAQPGAPVRVKITFQPDCFRPALSAACDKRKTGTRLDLGPQIAVWIEKADRTFVDTVMVTNLVALRGLGNRPGAVTLPSAPKFPYGKRPTALPVWAWARGKTYDTVVMQDGPDRELWLGFHESVSSPDPYYCRPMSLTEIDVDAITCPTNVFNSAKGKLVKSPRSAYPPRNDLKSFTDRDCDEPGKGGGACPMSAKQYAALNDLDAVATATPDYGRPFTKAWEVPANLPEGEYAVLVEISKEFDTNPSYNPAVMAHTDPQLSDSGLTNNFGQPSVVFRVPFRLSRSQPVQATAIDMFGYGEADPQKVTGKLLPPDSTISDAPGSGKGRLLVIAQPALDGSGTVSGRVHVTTDMGGRGVVDAGRSEATDGSPADGAPPPACPGLALEVANLEVPGDGLKPDAADIRFIEPTMTGSDAIEEYQIRVWEGTDQSEQAFRGGAPAAAQARGGGGETRTATVRDLKPETEYTVGIKPAGPCIDGTLSFTTFKTPNRAFTKLSGCFIATAAYGSPLAKNVDILRRARDRAGARSAFVRALVDAYERSSPPVADLLRGTEAGRAVVRALLSPIVEIARGAEGLVGR